MHRLHVLGIALAAIVFAAGFPSGPSPVAAGPPNLPGGACLPNLGQGMSLPNLPQGLSLPNLGQGMSLPNLPQGMSLPNLSQGSCLANLPGGACLPNLGQGMSLPNLPQGLSLPNLGQGMSLPNLPQGTSLPNLSQGSCLANLPQGASLPNLPQGASLPNLPQGASLPNLSQGASLPILPQGPSLLNIPPDAPTLPAAPAVSAPALVLSDPSISAYVDVLSSVHVSGQHFTPGSQVAVEVTPGDYFDGVATYTTVAADGSFSFVAELAGDCLGGDANVAVTDMVTGNAYYADAGRYSC